MSKERGSNDFAIDLCRALGLDATRICHLRLDFAQGAVTVQAEIVEPAGAVNEVAIERYDITVVKKESVGA